MNILSNLKAVSLVTIFITLSLMSCDGDGTTVKKNKLGEKEMEKVEAYVATSLECHHQEKIATSQRKKLLIFDPTGIFPENLYTTSPSNKLKNDILMQLDFRHKVAEMCDLFFVTQDCEVGAKLTNEFKVTNFPTVMVIGEDGRTLYKKEKLISLTDLYGDLEMLF